MKNYITNGNFNLWSLGTSTGAYSTTNTEKFLSDKWSVFLGTSSTISNYQRVNFTTGQTLVPNNPDYYSQIIVNASGDAANGLVRFSNKIINVAHLANKTITVSFYASAGAVTPNLGLSLRQNFGTAGSPSAAVTAIGAIKFVLSAAFTKYTATITIPSISGKTLGTDSDYNSFTALEFYLSAGSAFNTESNSTGAQTNTFNISQVQVEVGTLATQFEYRNASTELIAAQNALANNGIDAGTVKGTTPTAFGLSLIDDAAATNALDTLGGTAVGKSMFTAINKAAQQALVAGSGLDADTVSGYGIGVVPALKSGISLNSLTLPGLYTCDNTCTDGPIAGGLYSVFVECYNQTNLFQTATQVISTTQVRQWVRIDGTGGRSSWFEIWNASSDGPGSGLDADTVSGYGIGVNNASVVTFNSITKSGVYSCLGAGAPTGSTAKKFTVVTVYYDSTTASQLAFSQEADSFNAAYNSWLRLKTGGTWGGWEMFWNTKNDGNDGQPPAPKPTETAAVAGTVTEVKTAGPGTWYANGTLTPDGDANKKYFVNSITSNGNDITGRVQGLRTGNTLVAVVSAAEYITASCWRVL